MSFVLITLHMYFGIHPCKRHLPDDAQDEKESLISYKHIFVHVSSSRYRSSITLELFQMEARQREDAGVEQIQLRKGHGALVLINTEDCGI
jgi:hypothetical protein